MRGVASAGAASLIVASPALAQTTQPEIADTVLVTGVVIPVSDEKMGHALTVIDAAQIEEGGYRLVADVLRQVSGVAINRAGPLGGLTQARIRGAEANHTLVLLDGIDLSAAGNGETDLSALLSGDIERIEILRGPQSGLYGSNATAGVINLITRRDIEGGYVGGSLEAGSFNTADLQARGGAGNGAAYVAGGFHARRTDGYDVSSLDVSAGSPLVPGDSEGAKIATVYLRGGVQVTPQFRIDAISRYNRRQGELDGQAYSGAIAGQSFDDASTTRTSDLNLGVTGELSLLDGGWLTTGSLSWTETASDDLSFFFPSGFASPSGNEASRATGTLRSTLAFGPSAFRSYLTGFADSKAERYLNTCPDSPPGVSTCTPAQLPEQERDMLGVGAHYRAEIASQLFLSATLRHDDNADFGDADTYSVAGAWALPGTGTRLHASIGTGVTNPSFYEQFGFDPGSYVGNPALQPEESEGWDAGVEQTLFGGRAIVDVTWFEATLENEITTVFAPPLYIGTPVNSAGVSDRRGIEFSAMVRPTDALDITGSYTWLHATEPTGIEVRRPENQAALDANWRILGGRVELNLGVTHNGEQVDTDFSTFQRRTMDAYTLFRLGGSYRINDSLEVFARAENLADEAYEEIIGYRGAPRGVYVGVRFHEELRSARGR